MYLIWLCSVSLQVDEKQKAEIVNVASVDSSCGVACRGSAKNMFLLVTIFVMLRPNPICDLFTRMFTGDKGMLEGSQPPAFNLLWEIH